MNEVVAVAVGRRADGKRSCGMQSIDGQIAGSSAKDTEVNKGQTNLVLCIVCLSLTIPYGQGWATLLPAIFVSYHFLTIAIVHSLSVFCVVRFMFG